MILGDFSNSININHFQITAKNLLTNKYKVQSRSFSTGLPDFISRNVAKFNKQIKNKFKYEAKQYLICKNMREEKQKRFANQNETFQPLYKSYTCKIMYV